MRTGGVAAALALALAIAEASLRLAGIGQITEFTPDQRWGYLMRAGQVVHSRGRPLRINALGLRGSDVEEVKAPRSVRALFVGDSVTYGGGRIAEEQLFCRIVEEQARRHTPGSRASTSPLPGGLRRTGGPGSRSTVCSVPTWSCSCCPSATWRAPSHGWRCTASPSAPRGSASGEWPAPSGSS